MTDQTPETAVPSKLTPEQKKEAERRLAPLMQTLVDVTRLRLDVMNHLVEVGPGNFDPQEVHHLLTTQFEEAKRRFDTDLLMVKRMLAVEALRQEGRLSADGGATLHSVQEKAAAMDADTRHLQRQARAQARESVNLPGPR